MGTGAASPEPRRPCPADGHRAGSGGGRRSSRGTGARRDQGGCGSRSHEGVPGACNEQHAPFRIRRGDGGGRARGIRLVANHALGLLGLRARIGASDGSQAVCGGACWRDGRTSGPPRFDIRARSGYWDQCAKWPSSPGRHAHVYVFAWPADAGGSVDQREPANWQFYVVPECRLPDQKTIGLSTIRHLAEPCGAEGLLGRVAAAMAEP